MLHRVIPSVPVVLVTFLLASLLAVVAATPAHAECRQPPIDGNVSNSADEAVNINDIGDFCPGPTVAILYPGEHSDKYMEDTDRFWDNKYWINPSENIYEPNERYDINYSQDFNCFDREKRVNGFFIEVQCD